MTYASNDQSFSLTENGLRDYFKIKDGEEIPLEDLATLAGKSTLVFSGGRRKEVLSVAKTPSVIFFSHSTIHPQEANTYALPLGCADLENAPRATLR